MKRDRQSFEGESAPLTSNPTKRVENGEEGEKKWNGQKERGLASIFASLKDSTFLRMTDTINLSDVWFLPRKVSRGTSKSILSVEFTILINGMAMIMQEYTFKIGSDELLRMIYLAKKMRAAMDPRPFPYRNYDEWHDTELQRFQSSSDVVRGDGSEAAFAEYQFSIEDFNMRYRDPRCCLKTVFRKTCQHVYKNDLIDPNSVYGEEKNPNMEECVASRGTYRFCIEVRVVMLREGEEIDTVEEMPASQAY